jgi:hypothetical protein
MKHGSFLRVLACAVVAAVATFSTALIARGQLPTTQLTSVFPPGGKQGTTVEVAIAGADMDDVEQLLFSHAGLKSTPKMTSATPLEPARPVANQFTVAIAADVPPGVYEVRAMGRFGLSNPRSFMIGTQNEAVESTGNSSVDKAADLPLDITLNGRVDANTFDYLRLNLKKDQRVRIEVVARRIDSRLDGTLVVLDANGHELKRVKEGAGADPVLDFTAPADGVYQLKLYDEVYGGGNDYFYRLTASSAPYVDFVFPPSGPAGSTTEYTLYGRNLSGGQPAEGLTINGVPLEKLTVKIPLPADEAATAKLVLSGSSPLARAWQDGIEYRLPTPSGPANPVSVYFARSPNMVVEQEPNNAAKSAQKIAVPCEFVGQFYPERDMDWVQFDAKKGQTYWIDVISNQLGLASDPFLAIYRVTKNDKGEEQQSEVVQVDDLQERGRRNPNVDELDATNDDPSYKFVVPDDGTYRLLVRDQFGDSRKDPSFVYRLVIRTPTPDFRLLAYPNSPPPTQQQQIQTPLAATSIRKGGTAAFTLAVQRRDEFDGEIAVSVEGLPSGVTCPGAILGGGINDGSLVLVAAEDALAWAGPIKIIAKAKVADREVTREARYAVVVWGTANRQQQPAEFRLAPVLQLGVIDKEMEPALVRIGDEKVFETSLGGNVELPITITRRGDFKDPVKLVAVGLTQQMKPKDVTLDGDKGGKFELALNQQNIRPGSYTFYMKGEAKRKYTRNPEAVTAAEAEQKRIGEMIKSLNDQIKAATDAKDEAALKAAQDKLKEVNSLKTQCDKRLDDAKKANQPKDVAFALISTPIKLRINASPLKLAPGQMAGPIKSGTKQELDVKLERLYGFADQVELTLEPPSAAQGLSASKVTLKKDESDGKLEITAADNAAAGQHACTLRAKARFNNVQVESTTTVNITIEGK